MIGVRRKKDNEAEKGITKQNQPVLVGFVRPTFSTDYLVICARPGPT
jgi:hypothetical protein